MVLDGLQRLIEQQDFSQSDLVNDELNKYRRESNSVALFIEEENWVKSLTQKIKLTELYENYKVYCTDSGQRPFTRNNFSKRLRELDFEVQLKAQITLHMFGSKK